MSEPPPLPSATRPKSAGSGLATCLSLLLLLFLASGFATLLSDSFFIFLGRQDFAIFSVLLVLAMLGAGFVGCLLMALIPAIPKRFFLPVCLFIPVAYIAVLPLLVYFYRQAQWVLWGVGLGEVLLGLFIVKLVRKAGSPRWPLVPAARLHDRKFSWGNLVAVAFAGLFVLIPALVLYTGFSAQLAVHHFTDGFVTLRPSGISMQVRKYTRDDGQKITLVPMSHIGAPEFYRDLAASFPEDAVILMEGVSDEKKIMDHGVGYARAAKAAGGVEQVTAFKPRGEVVPADVDVSTFSPATLEMLKVAMLLHAKGITPETLPLLMKPTPPGLEQQLLDDLLTKRNRHLLNVIQERLQKPGTIVVPWGAAHMPEIAREIQKSGFRMVDKQDFVALPFGS